MWYVSWHPLLHKDMPGRHIISRICFPSPPLHLCIVVIKRQERSTEMCSDPRDVFHIVSRKEKRLHCVFFKQLHVRGEEKSKSGGLLNRPVWSEWCTVSLSLSLFFDVQWIIYSARKFVKTVYLGWNVCFFSSSSFSHFVFTCSFFLFYDASNLKV